MAETCSTFIVHSKLHAVLIWTAEQGVRFIVSPSTAAVSHRKPAYGHHKNRLKLYHLV